MLIFVRDFFKANASLRIKLLSILLWHVNCVHMRTRYYFYFIFQHNELSHAPSILTSHHQRCYSWRFTSRCKLLDRYEYWIVLFSFIFYIHMRTIVIRAKSSHFLNCLNNWVCRGVLRYQILGFLLTSLIISLERSLKKKKNLWIIWSWRQST